MFGHASAVRCVPGLEPLLPVDNLTIKQKVDVIEALTGGLYEQKNIYEVYNGVGQRMFVAYESTDCCTRCLCGSNRKFDFELKDARGRELIHLSRGVRWTSCLCPCCLQKVNVSAPLAGVNSRLGVVRQKWTPLCCPKFALYFADNPTRAQVTISGPCCKTACVGQNVEFEVLTGDGKSVIGRISKEWGGIIKEGLTSADNFAVFFPIDLDVRAKALLIAAVILIDFMYYEKKPTQ